MRDFKQIPLPDSNKFYHPHNCSICKKWSNLGTLTYSEKLENTKFICKRCQPVKLIPAPLPKKTEFRKLHECKKCYKKSKKGVLTYCPRCEEGEFLCPICVIDWFADVAPDHITEDFT